MSNKIDIKPKEQILFIYMLLAAITLAVYWQVNHFDFVNIDDLTYVTHNDHVQSGITLEGIRWAFSTTHAEFWHPLTWLSLMLDYELYGMNAGAFHMTNLILHILSTLLLFWLFHRMTGALWKSAFVAAFFALHPLHVESVAWIAERKDVLSAFFWMLTLCLYVFYTEKQSIKRYLLVVFSFILALMSKPMVVTLPVIMILLDYWPLNRFQSQNGHYIARQLKEKWPFFVLSAVFSIITLFVHFKPSALNYSFYDRFANAPVAFITYLGKTFWPYDLTFYYPFSTRIPIWQVLLASLFVIFLTVFVTMLMKRFPPLFSGWLWYAVSIAPVTGIIKISSFALADRYHYLPSIGISIMMAWGFSYLLHDKGAQKKILLPAATAFLAILSMLTWQQCGYWKNTTNLSNHALRVTGNNFLAHYVLAYALFSEGKTEAAIHQLSEAIRLNSKYADAYKSRGLCYFQIGQYEKAVSDFDASIKLKPADALIYHIRGTANVKLGNDQSAIEDYNKAIILKKDYADVYNDRAYVYFIQGQKALGCYDAKRGCKLGNCRILNGARERGLCR